jgi:hypothetical protein
MAITLAIPNVEAVDDCVWQAKLDPRDLLILAAEATRIGPMSVLILSQAPSFDRTTHTLSFSSAIAHVLNLGYSDDVIIIESSSPEDACVEKGVPMFTGQMPRQSAYSIPPIRNRKAQPAELAITSGGPIERTRRYSNSRREG